MTAPEKLKAFLEWRGWSQAACADACSRAILARLPAGQEPVDKCSPAMVSQVIAGKKRPGLEIAHAIETVTGTPNEKGEVWELGPIRTEDWPIPAKSAA